MSAKSNAPVVIKRKRIVAGGGHHGGAWKVAYADFVTAMMAYFMLMWLLNATTEKQRKGIADYFSPTIPVNRVSGGGPDAFSGDSVFTEKRLAKTGSGAASERPTEEAEARGAIGTQGDAEDADRAAEDRAFASVLMALKANSGESMASDRALRHIVTRVTDEGLIIEIHDLDGDPLFADDGATPMPVLRDLAGELSRVFRLTANRVAVNGHVRSYPVVLAADPVWDLSTARAQAVHRLLDDGGLDDGRIERVSGFADRKPAAENPAAVRNNRIEVILLRQRPETSLGERAPAPRLRQARAEAPAGLPGAVQEAAAEPIRGPELH
jgi:chemotaxis protein MotB